jgi:hypothetical protein
MARKTSTVTLSDGRAVPIRQLGWLQLRSSHSASQQASARNLVAMGGAEFMAAWKAMQSPATDQSDESASTMPDVVPTDPMSGHDLFTVLRCGIPSWSQEQIEDLEETDAELLGREILGLTPASRSAEQEKNGASPSTGA